MFQKQGATQSIILSVKLDIMIENEAEKQLCSDRIAEEDMVRMLFDSHRARSMPYVRGYSKQHGAVDHEYSE